ncbi:hypothetical protein SH661x_003432 [Planctomicrobium sp. SH661]|uniref:hypothetical protein n=1 Tax=Planctomicrobium sp. SH661 TaxID=3448124 RepID=UPI003F5B342B
MLKALQILAFGAVLGAQSAWAQSGAVTVQQPVVSGFGVQTAVSVPDRGGVLLGGVSSAGEFASRSGFFPTATRFGAGASASSMEARVWIHDAAEMDHALLKVGEERFGGLSPADQDRQALQILRKNRSGAATAVRSREQNSMDRAQALQILRSRR